MTKSTLNDSIDTLQMRPFALHPDPAGIDNNRFVFIDNTDTYITIQNLDTEKRYDLSATLIEFITPGIVRVTRKLETRNGSFV
jgi:hypothetical protein